MAKAKKEVIVEEENQNIAEYASKNGVPEEDVAKFFDIAGSYGVLQEEHKEVIAKLVKSFLTNEDKEEPAPAKKTSRKASDEDVLVTAEGLRDLKIKHYILVNWKRAECAEQIKIARGFGDLSENAEYDAAKEAQGKIEAEIAQIENKIQHAVIIASDSKSKTKVGLGDTVTIKEIGEEEEETYTIVGTTEADAGNNKISNESPLGKALVGKKIGDIIDVEAPMGIIKFEILTKE